MKKISTIFLLGLGFVLLGCSPSGSEQSQMTAEAPPAADADIDKQVEEYIQKFPYQDTYNYAVRYTNSDPANLNVWVLGQEPVLVKAGEDKVVRMNNDTYYKMAFVDLTGGPVVLGSSAPAEDRFSSFQLMDDRNVNYQNEIHPAGEYTLYFGAPPEKVVGKAIEVPSLLSVVIVRVEVKNKDDADDTAAAQSVFNGITISGEQPAEFPKVDVLGVYSGSVQADAEQKLDETFANVAFRLTAVGPDQELGKDVSYLNHSAGTKGGWGAPGTAHSSYETLFFDGNGDTLDGGKGDYSVTTEPPPVDAFWSLTVYDTARGGFLHPNKDDRYHINNTTAVANDDGTVTFNFKSSCAGADINCLEVPVGEFDIVARYYLPHESIRSGEWTLPAINLPEA